ncbi:MAG: hypothetical protein NVSMB9_31020 [Isosphaeraceae bacterium]
MRGWCRVADRHTITVEPGSNLAAEGLNRTTGRLDFRSIRKGFAGMAIVGLASTIVSIWILGQVAGGPRRPRVRQSRTGWQDMIRDPRNAVWVVVGSVILFGGGRKFLQGLRSRRVIANLEDPSVTPASIAAATEFGRAGMMELFRLLEQGKNPDVRDAAGKALSVLWARDELIAEEEKAVVRRGFQLQWRARRRYPREIEGPIPLTVSYGLPFLRENPAGVRADNLEWSQRIKGTGRASLEVFSPWSPGNGEVEFTVIPADFVTNGPHRLVVETRVRTVGLTESWELELPHAQFSFELDPRLSVNAILAAPAETLNETFAKAVRLVHGQVESEQSEGDPSFLSLNEELAIRNPPWIEVTTPLPHDLAHRIEVELEGVPGWYEAGRLCLISGGIDERSSPALSRSRIPLGSLATLATESLDRPGRRALRARLVSDPHLGWKNPDVRSLWGGSIATGWVDVEIVRR